MRVEECAPHTAGHVRIFCDVAVRRHEASAAVPGMRVTLRMTPARSFLRAGSIAFPDLLRVIAQNAVCEQLGFRLESDRAQMPVQVVDSVERPEEN